MMQHIRKILRDSTGATAIEYGLIAAIISISALFSMQAMGSQTSESFDTVRGAMAQGNSGA